MIPIQNVYYMLSYAYKALRKDAYRKMATESFDNTADLCAAILYQGVSMQLKQGLGREYIPQTETLSSLKGKIDYTASIKENTFIKRQMICFYDDFSVNTYMNRILKTTMIYLLNADISSDRKKDLKRVVIFFSEVDLLDRHTINWNFHFSKNNETYRMLIFVCHLVLKELIQSRIDGTLKMMDFLDEQNMHRLYEKFILEFYKQERPDIITSSKRVKWKLDDDNDAYLPAMQTDITLRKDNRTFIIDAKYYTNSMQSQYGNQSFHSGNMYQIFTYVKNETEQIREYGGEVSGMLLYAKTDENITPDNNVYLMSGNRITVHSLDLNRDFTEIKSELFAIADRAFAA